MLSSLFSGFTGSRRKPCGNIWAQSICRNICYLDFEKEKEVNLPDALAEEEPEFSGFVRCEKKIGITEEGQYFLEITDMLKFLTPLFYEAGTFLYMEGSCLLLYRKFRPDFL